MDYEAQACMDQTCAPVFKYFRTAQFGKFYLNTSDNSSERRRMLEVYVCYTLSAFLGEPRVVRTEWLTAQILLVQVQPLGDQIPTSL